MRAFVVVVVAMAIGALGYYGLSRVFEREKKDAVTKEAVERSEGQGAPSGVAEPAQTRPALPKPRPAFASRDEEENPRPVPGLGAATPTPSEDSGRASEPREPGISEKSAQPVPAVAQGLEGDRRLAWAAFESGNREGGLRLLKQIYAVWRDAPAADLTKEVLALLQGVQDIDQKLDYAGYILKRENSAKIFEDRLAESRRKLAVAEDGPEAAHAAWDELTAAYLVAGSRARRKQVRSLLDPFLERMVFSGRFTPVLASYTVRPGDTLSEIAARYRTTAASIQRLNKLTGEVLQPRQRLRILPGELRIFVDKRDFTLWTTVDGRVFLEFSVGLGKDDATPEGTFVIEDRLRDPTWFRPGQPPLPPGAPGNVLGTRWLGFKDTPEYSGYGIHGTSDPADIGKESSAGCLRLLKDDIELLFDFAGKGTKVVVRR